MTRDLTTKQKELLNDLYHKVLGGRDKLYKFIQEHHQESNISRRQVMEWLRNQELNQITTTPKKTVKIISTIPRYPLSKLQIDLIDLSKTESKGYKYIMTTIDTFSKYVWLKKLKNKTVETTARELKNVLNEISDMMKKLNKVDNGNRILQPKTVQTDNGTEFKTKFNKVLVNKDIKHIYGEPYHSTSQGIVERMNRTIRNKILKLKLLNSDNNVWADKMNEIEFSINATYSDSIRTTPLKAIAIEKSELLKSIQGNIEKQVRKNNSNFNDKVLKKGQQVRLRTKLNKNDKITDYPTFSNEIYTISQVNKPKDDFRPTTYYLKGIKGRYTYNDLMPINTVDNTLKKTDKYDFQKIVKPATQKGILGYWVKWKGYKTPTFEPHENLILDVPKDVNKVFKEWNIKYNPKNKRWSWNNPRN